MASSFPGAIQDFPIMIDMTATDGTLVAQFQTAMQAGDLETARTILASIPSYQNKVLTAELMNNILDTITAVQKYFQARYSNGYILSETQPVAQETGDYWFEITS